MSNEKNKLWLNDEEIAEIEGEMGRLGFASTWSYATISNLLSDRRSLITTIESKKEYWEGYSEESLRIESQLRDQIQSQKEELKRIREHVKPLYHSTDKETHLISCRVLHDPDRYPPKFDEHRFA
jgi:hypothetical protein